MSSVMLFALKVFSVMVLNHVKGIFKYFGNEALRVSSVMVFVIVCLIMVALRVSSVMVCSCLL